MSQYQNQRLLLAVILLRAIYAALVLGLGAMDIRLVHDIAPRMTATQYSWPAGDGDELRCNMGAWNPAANWPPRCIGIRAEAPTAFTQRGAVRIVP